MIPQTLIRKWLAVAIPAIIVQLVIFKLYYPYASFFYTDSFSYIFAAASNQDVNTWPIGYSKFLRVFNTFIHSDTGLVTFQYLFLQTCGLFLFFTIRILLKPTRAISITLFIFTVFNPLTLYLANAVSSDALFIGLSLLWISLLLLIIKEFSWRRMLVLSIILFTVLSLRFIAFYYPLVTIIGLSLTRIPRRQKMLAMALSLILPASFLLYTARASKEVTGLASFSAFGGWQLANNAIYGYNNIPRLKRLQPPAPFTALDSLVRLDMDATKYSRTLFDLYYPGDYYIWSEKGPLIKYALQQQKKDAEADYFQTYSRLSPLYAAYGAWLIRQYPSGYLQYYEWPNAIRYALPPLEFMGVYNSGEDTVSAVAKYFFRYKSNKVHAFSRTFQASLLSPYPLLNMVLTLFFLGSFFLFMTTKGMARAYPFYKACLLLAGAYWLFHTGASIFSSPVALRYQVVLSTLNLSFSLLTIQYLLSWEKDRSSITPFSNNPENEKEPLHRRPGRFLPDRIVRLRSLR